MFVPYGWAHTRHSPGELPLDKMGQHTREDEALSERPWLKLPNACVSVRIISVPFLARAKIVRV